MAGSGDADADARLPGRRRGVDRARSPVEKPRRSDGDQDRHPATWQGAVAARDESRGSIDAVTTTRSSRPTAPSRTSRAWAFCEPSSAASVAGVAKAAAGGAILASELVVAVLTGNGLKDPETAEKLVAGRIVESDATEAGVTRALGW